MKINTKKHKLSDVAIVRHGYQFRDYDFVDEGIDVVKIGQIGNDGKLKLKNSSKISSYRLKEFNNIQLYNGDVLMALTGATLGKTAIIKNIDKALVQNYRVGYFNPKDATQLDKTFLYYSLVSENIQNEILGFINAGAQGNIGKSDFEKIEINFPPLPQQQKIAQILTTCDALIEKTETAIAKYQAMKQGLMHDLFTRGIDVKTGKLRPKQQDAPQLYKESELGWIPKEWEVKKLEDYISLLKSGLSRLLSQQDIGIPVMTSGNIQNEKIEFRDLKYWYLKDPQGAKTENYILEKDDILLCFINSLDQIGKLAIFEGFNRFCIYTTNLFRIKSKVENNPKFLFYLLSSGIVQNEIKLITKPAVNQASFTTKDFLNIPVPYIEKNEQVRIKETIEGIDKKLQTEQSALSKYQQLKMGLMQDLLSGKVEVKV
jgi:type I restriction enzyme S subunit